MELINKSRKARIVATTQNSQTILVIPFHALKGGRVVNTTLEWIRNTYPSCSVGCNQVSYEENGQTTTVIFTTEERWVIDEYTAQAPRSELDSLINRLKAKGYYLIQGRVATAKAQVPVQSMQQVLSLAGL